VAAVGEVVEVTGAAVVAESIEEVAAPVVSTERAAARSEDRWAAALPWVRAAERQYADQWVAAPR
jgi:hypothetical protein